MTVSASSRFDRCAMSLKKRLKRFCQVLEISERVFIVLIWERADTQLLSASIISFAIPAPCWVLAQYWLRLKSWEIQSQRDWFPRYRRHQPQSYYLKNPLPKGSYLTATSIINNNLALKPWSFKPIRAQTSTYPPLYDWRCREFFSWPNSETLHSKSSTKNLLSGRAILSSTDS